MFNLETDIKLVCNDTAKISKFAYIVEGTVIGNNLKHLSIFINCQIHFSKLITYRTKDSRHISLGTTDNVYVLRRSHHSNELLLSIEYSPFQS